VEWLKVKNLSSSPRTVKKKKIKRKTKEWEKLLSGSSRIGICWEEGGSGLVQYIGWGPGSSRECFQHSLRKLPFFVHRMPLLAPKSFAACGFSRLSFTAEVP
jgi:hypothetical protein